MWTVALARICRRQRDCNRIGNCISRTPLSGSGKPPETQVRTPSHCLCPPTRSSSVPNIAGYRKTQSHWSIRRRTVAGCRRLRRSRSVHMKSLDSKVGTYLCANQIRKGRHSCYHPRTFEGWSCKNLRRTQSQTCVRMHRHSLCSRFCV